MSMPSIPAWSFWENLQSVWEKKQELREKLDRYRKHFQEDTQISKADLEAGELIRNEEENPLPPSLGVDLVGKTSVCSTSGRNGSLTNISPTPWNHHQTLPVYCVKFSMTFL